MQNVPLQSFWFEEDGLDDAAEIIYDINLSPLPGSLTTSLPPSH